MQLIIDEVVSLQRRLEELGRELKENKISAMQDIAKESKNISKVYTTFIGDTQELRGMGVELPIDILVTQLKNYVEACEKCDMMMLTDVVNYELLDTISVYREILEQLI